MQTNVFLVYVGILCLGVLLGYILRSSRYEGFVDVTETSCSMCQVNPCTCTKKYAPTCRKCNTKPCGCQSSIDMSKYVLKTSIPSCPDMSQYMLKSNCPATPDMSKYMLKTAAPVCPPCITTCNKPCKIGECPPCPRIRCPVQEEPTKQCKQEDSYRSSSSCPAFPSVKQPYSFHSDEDQESSHYFSGASPLQPSSSNGWFVRPLMATI
jgi:hypothetical protein